MGQMTVIDNYGCLLNKLVTEVLFNTIEEEFTYKANYYEEGKRCSEKDKHSCNYFESMFHPLYYKMFRCKREYCNFSQFCPFFHSEEEKKTWDRTFSNFIRKDRISYVKDKQNTMNTIIIQTAIIQKTTK